MLNYIWLSMIVIGILTAAGFDIYDEARNTNRNGMPLEANVEISKLENAIVEGEIVVPADRFNSFYGTSLTAEVRQPIMISTSEKGDRTFVLPVSDSTPKQWKGMAKGAAGKDKLSGNVRSFRISEDGKNATVQIEFEQIRFVKMKAITQAALDIAGVAVTLALGLIGIMALWLGVMKVAEEAGLLRVVARILSPIMKRIFPDVPSDHPAVGAMIMNIAANMLGLNNAATPLGLKAMDELEKLNPKPGTATNAMVTFLAINTGGLILIPATAIAVRASVGSLNPGIIIGTSIVGAGCATVAGIIAAKLLQRLPRFKKDAEVANG